MSQTQQRNTFHSSYLFVIIITPTSSAGNEMLLLQAPKINEMEITIKSDREMSNFLLTKKTANKANTSQIP